LSVRRPSGSRLPSSAKRGWSRRPPGNGRTPFPCLKTRGPAAVAEGTPCLGSSCAAPSTSAGHGSRCTWSALVSKASRSPARGRWQVERNHRDPGAARDPVLDQQHRDFGCHGLPEDDRRPDPGAGRRLPAGTQGQSRQAICWRGFTHRFEDPSTKGTRLMPLMMPEED
jgi:hypothetical protein